MEDLLARLGRIGVDRVDRRPAAVRERPADERGTVVVLEGERDAQELGRVRILPVELAGHLVELVLDERDRVAVELPSRDVGEPGERRVALEKRVARELAVAVGVEDRLWSRADAPVLVLERVRELVRDQELADEVAPGEEAEQADPEAAGVERGPREEELLHPRVVEAGALLLVEALQAGLQVGSARDEAQSLVHRLRPLHVALREALLDLVPHDPRDLLARERARGNVRSEVEAAREGQIATDRGERILVHDAVADDPAWRASLDDERDDDQEQAAGQMLAWRLQHSPPAPGGFNTRLPHLEASPRLLDDDRGVTEAGDALGAGEGGGPERIGTDADRVVGPVAPGDRAHERVGET